MPPSPRGIVNRKLIIALAAQHRLPAVYFIRSFAKDGGLISYGPDAVALQYRLLSLLATAGVASNIFEPIPSVDHLRFQDRRQRGPHITKWRKS